MTTIPPAVQRTLAHTRNIRLCGYRRDDGLWDIEAQLLDTRAYDSLSVSRGLIKAGDSIHDISVCVTVDDDLVIRAITSLMQTHPFPNCPGALPSLTGLIGATLGPGWRRQIDTHLGGEKGCTHIREMLLQVATTAFQTITGWVAQQSGDILPPSGGKPPRHLGQCHGWALDGPIVAKLYPEFSIKKIDP